MPGVGGVLGKAKRSVLCGMLSRCRSCCMDVCETDRIEQCRKPLVTTQTVKSWVDTKVSKPRRVLAKCAVQAVKGTITIVKRAMNDTHLVAVHAAVRASFFESFQHAAGEFPFTARRVTISKRTQYDRTAVGALQRNAMCVDRCCGITTLDVGKS